MTKHISKKLLASSIGGKRRVELHGNPGTKEGRIKGGKKSVLVQRTQNNTNFKTLLEIPFPNKDEALAEVVGIFFGDGHLSYYQASVTLNNEDDIDYLEFVGNLLEKKLKVHTGRKIHRHAKATDIVISSRMTVKHLSKLGIPLGNKVRAGLTIPSWILSKKKFLSAFLRGVFDTDGSMYQEKKVVGQKTYYYPCISISSASCEFLKEIKDALSVFSIHATLTSKNNALIRTRKGVTSFMEIVGTHNMKHLTKYRNILQLSLGNVA